MNNIDDLLEKLKEYSEILDNDEDLTLEQMSNLQNLLEFNNNTLLDVKIKKLHPLSKIPTYSKNGDAGLDLTITSVIYEDTNKIKYGFGIALEIPKSHVGLIFPRSSIEKYELILSNCVGVIDSNYRGEIMASFKKTNNEFNYYQVGERGAQIIIFKYPTINFIEVDELSETNRGDGGYGSSGK